MKKFLISVLVIALIAVSGVLFLVMNGYDLEAVVSAPENMYLKAECSTPTDLFLTSTTDLTIRNSSSDDYVNVKVRVNAYDKNGNIIRQKETIFTRVLNSGQSISKVITVPSKTVRCDGIILGKNISPKHY